MSSIKTINEYTLNEFITSDYTIKDYMKNMISFKTIQEHANALSKCVARFGNYNTLVVKERTDSGRIVYKHFDSIDEFNKRCDVVVSVITNSNEDVSKENTIEVDIKHIISKYKNECFTHFDRQFTFVDSDQLFFIHDDKLISTFKYNVNGYIINDLPVFAPPAVTNLNIHLVNDWFKFMLGRIYKEYHNAFIDLIYSIRYRLLSKGPSPSKLYILHGEENHESNSFLFDCLGEIFGNMYQTCSKDNLTKSVYNSFASNTGLVLFEEVQSDKKLKNKELIDVAKMITTPKGTMRKWYKEDDNVKHYAIFGMITNQSDLDGLVYESDDLTTRIALMEFNPFDGSWDDILDQYLGDPTFTYSLYAYIIAENGFITNEGKDYKYTLNKYLGEERSNYIRDIKNRPQEIVEDLVNRFRYDEDCYNEALELNVDETSIACIQVDELDHIEYIDAEIITARINEACSKYKHFTIKQAEINSLLEKKGWLYADRVEVGDNIYSNCYYKLLKEDSILYNVHIKMNQEHEEQENKNKLLHEIVNELTTNHTLNTKKYDCIFVDQVNAVCKQKDQNKIIKRSELEEELALRGYTKTPTRITAKGFDKLGYKKMK